MCSAQASLLLTSSAAGIIAIAVSTLERKIIHNLSESIGLSLHSHSRSPHAVTLVDSRIPWPGWPADGCEALINQSGLT